MMAMMAVGAPTTLVHLSRVDIAIVVIYFVLVIAIGFYLKRFATTGEDFFLAGREMTAWVAGLAFVSANLGSLELLGWAGNAYQYGIMAAHWYWIGAIPAMVFLGIVMMPFYYISKTHSVPGYLKLRYGTEASALSAVTFAFMTILMSGVNMYAMAVVMEVVLGWNLHFSIIVSSLTVGVYVAAGGLFSAIFNEVLQFFLIWFGALLIPILGLIEAGGWKGLVARIQHNFPDQNFTHAWSTLGKFQDNPMGMHWTGIVFGLGAVISMGRWCTIIGLVISIGTAYLAMGFASIMDYVQALFSFFIAPLFGTVLLGMLWKRATPLGGFLGLLAGTLTAIGIFLSMKIDHDMVAIFALSPMAKGLAQDMYQALWSCLVCVAVTVGVSLVTTPKPT